LAVDVDTLIEEMEIVIRALDLERGLERSGFKGEVFRLTFGGGNVCGGLEFTGPGNICMKPGITVITTSEMSDSKVNCGSGSDRSTVMRSTAAAQLKYAASTWGWLSMA